MTTPEAFVNSLNLGELYSRVSVLYVLADEAYQEAAFKKDFGGGEVPELDALYLKQLQISQCLEQLDNLRFKLRMLQEDICRSETRLKGRDSKQNSTTSKSVSRARTPKARRSTCCAL
jgi:hypothetical protein